MNLRKSYHQYTRQNGARKPKRNEVQEKRHETPFLKHEINENIQAVARMGVFGCKG
jgi:hypothetical protein